MARKPDIRCPVFLEKIMRMVECLGLTDAQFVSETKNPNWKDAGLPTDPQTIVNWKEKEGAPIKYYEEVIKYSGVSFNIVTDAEISAEVFLSEFIGAKFGNNNSKLEETSLNDEQRADKKIEGNYSFENEDVSIIDTRTFTKLFKNQKLPPKIEKLPLRRADFSASVALLLSKRHKPVALCSEECFENSKIANALSWGVLPFYNSVVWIVDEINTLEELCDEIIRMSDKDIPTKMEKKEKVKRLTNLLNQGNNLIIFQRSSNSNEAAMKDIIDEFHHVNRCDLIMICRKGIEEYTSDIIINLPSNAKKNNDIFSEIDNFNPDSFGARVTRFCSKILSENQGNLLRILGCCWNRTVTEELILLIGLTSDDLKADLEELIKHGLLNKEKHEETFKYSVHVLLYDYSNCYITQDKKIEIMEMWLDASKKYLKKYIKKDFKTATDMLEMEIKNLFGAVKYAQEKNYYNTVIDLTKKLWDSGVMKAKGYVKDGIQMLEHGLTSAEELSQGKYDKSVLYFLTKLASANYFYGDYRKGYEKVKIAIDNINDNNASSELKFDIYLFAATYKRLKGEYDESSDFNKKALTIAESSESDTKKSRCHGNIALDFYLRGDFDKAIKKFEIAIDFAGQDESLKAKHRSRIANCLVAKGKYEEARDIYEYTLKVAINDNNLIGKLYDFLGLASAYRGIYQVTKETHDYEEALSNWEKSNDISVYREITAYLLAERVFLYAVKNEPEKGIKKARAALDAAKNIELPHAIGGAYLALAECEYLLGKYEEAIETCEKAKNVGAGIDSQNIKADALCIIGKSKKEIVGEHWKKDLEEALKYFEDIEHKYKPDEINKLLKE